MTYKVTVTLLIYFLGLLPSSREEEAQVRGDIIAEGRSTMNELIALAEQQTGACQTCMESVGLKYTDLPLQFIGVGVAIGFSPTKYVVVSIMGGGSENHLMITSGVLNNIDRDRLAALEAANSFNQRYTAYPVFPARRRGGMGPDRAADAPKRANTRSSAVLQQLRSSSPSIVLEYRQTIAHKNVLGVLGRDVGDTRRWSLT